MTSTAKLPIKRVILPASEIMTSGRKIDQAMTPEAETAVSKFLNHINENYETSGELDKDTYATQRNAQIQGFRGGPGEKIDTLAKIIKKVMAEIERVYDIKMTNKTSTEQAALKQDKEQRKQELEKLYEEARVALIKEATLGESARELSFIERSTKYWRNKITNKVELTATGPGGAPPANIQDFLKTTKGKPGFEDTAFTLSGREIIFPKDQQGNYSGVTMNFTVNESVFGFGKYQSGRYKGTAINNDIKEFAVACKLAYGGNPKLSEGERPQISLGLPPREEFQRGLRALSPVRTIGMKAIYECMKQGLNVQEFNTHLTDGQKNEIRKKLAKHQEKVLERERKESAALEKHGVSRDTPDFAMRPANQQTPPGQQPGPRIEGAEQPHRTPGMGRGTGTT